MKMLRVLNKDEQNLIERVYESVKHTILRADEITWVNLYVGGKFHLDFPECDELDKWVATLYPPLFTHLPPDQKVYPSYGFLMNPANSKKKSTVA